ncbi:MAG TPA: OFA family MFS transporter, partial [Egibacteraceae bacterium]|nr:OFA family MFS transporter [Egibacteraceae bacterium]
ASRWLVAAGAVLVQLALGAVYAWSVFARPLEAQMGWTKSQASLPFVVVIGVLFIGTFAGGRIQDRVGPRPVVLAGGLLYAAGVMLASLADQPGELWLLVATYGVMAGIGLGLGYIVPIAMLVKWFPDKRGLITGIAVGGFGAGALVTAPIAEALIDPADVTQTFLALGAGYLVATLLGGALFRDPPAGWSPPGWQGGEARALGEARQYALGEALRTRQWWLLTAILALNTTAGIALISQASPAAQALTGATPAAAAGLVGILAIFNGAGRVLWAWLSDHAGRMRVFLAMLGVQAVAFFLLARTGSILLFGVLAALVYLAYGGGFGTMPATAADYFGTRHAGAIYGAMIVAWSIGGVAGPLAIAAIAERTGGFSTPFTVIAVLALLSMALPLLTRPPAERGRAPEPRRAAARKPRQRHA